MPITLVPNTGYRHNIFPKYNIEFGPWTSGLDTLHDPALLSTSSLQDCINYQIQDDGKLKLRPSVTKIDPPTAPDYRNVVSALGSFTRYNNKLVPVIGVSGTADTYDGIKFYYYADGAWSDAFTDIDYSSGIVGDGVIPVQIIGYNNMLFVMFSKYGLATSGSLVGTLADLTGPANLNDSGPTDQSYLRKGLVFKDRIILMSDNDIYWSTANPSGDTSNDWSQTAPNTAGNLGLIREILNQFLYDMVVFNDAIYIVTSNRVCKFDWATDPNIDGQFTVVSDAIGGRKFVTYNGDLYLFNSQGLYRLINNYFVEVSEPVRDTIRQNVQDLAERNVTYFGVDSVFNGVGELSVSMHQLGNLLLLGPFNSIAPARYNDHTDDYTGNIYLVYNMDLQVWTKWQFSPNTGDVYPFAGPSQAPMPSAYNSPSSVEHYVWVGLTLVNGALGGSGIRQQCSYILDTVDLVRTDMNCKPYDDAGSGHHKWIGAKFATAEVDLGDSNLWKRLQTTTLDAFNYRAPVFFSHGVPVMGYLLDNNITSDQNSIVNVNTPSTGRLKFAKAYRMKRFGFYYDSITGLDSVASSSIESIDLDGIRRISSIVTLSRKEPAAIGG